MNKYYTHTCTRTHICDCSVNCINQSHTLKKYQSASTLANHFSNDYENTIMSIVCIDTFPSFVYKQQPQMSVVSCMLLGILVIGRDCLLDFFFNSFSLHSYNYCDLI